MLCLHHIGNAALTALAVHTNHCFVVATNVLGVDRQVGNTPRVIRIAECFKALLDGVLVTARERGVHKVAHVWVALWHWQTVTKFGSAAQRIDVGDVELGVNTIHHHVQRNVDEVEVAGAFAIAKQCAFNAICAGHDAELCSCGSGATVVVWVQRNQHGVAVLDGANEPLDHIAIHVGGVALNGCGQVENQWISSSGLNDIHHGFADFNREVGLGEAEAFG